MKDGASVATRNVLISLCANVSGNDKSYKREGNYYDLLLVESAY